MSVCQDCGCLQNVNIKGCKACYYISQISQKSNLTSTVKEAQDIIVEMKNVISQLDQEKNQQADEFQKRFEVMQFEHEQKIRSIELESKKRQETVARDMNNFLTMFKMLVVSIDGQTLMENDFNEKFQQMSERENLGNKTESEKVIGLATYCLKKLQDDQMEE